MGERTCPQRWGMGTFQPTCKIVGSGDALCPKGRLGNCTLGRALSGALFLLGIATTQVLQGQDGDWRGGSSTAWDPFSESKMRTGGQCQV